MTNIKLKDDKLARGKYARSLYRIIGDYAPKVDPETKKTVYEKPCNCTDNDAFIMAISAPWGSGKTTFVNFLKQVLSLEGIEEGKELFYSAEEFKQSKNKYPKDPLKGVRQLNKSEVDIYNAWENDFYEDPLVPFFIFLMSTVAKAQAEFYLSSEALKASGDVIKNSIKEAVNEATKAIQDDASKGMETVTPFLKGVGAFFGKCFEGIPEIQKAMDDDTLIQELMNENQSYKERIDNTKKMLEKQIQKTEHKKIVVIIDELDRCKPTFAVKTLEIVKHLFNVPGLVFIFSLDITELQHCVKVVYGNEFDAIGYLERFFDYSTLLPRGNRKGLFQAIAEEFKIVKEGEAADDYYEICHSFLLSPREMRAVCASFFYLKKYELENYPGNALRLYFYLLVLKYKYPVEVMMYISSSGMIEERKKFYKEHLPVFQNYKVIVEDNGDVSDPFSQVFVQNKRISEFDGYRKIYESGSDDKYNTYTASNASLGSGESLSLALYEKDLENLKEIEDKLILEYLFSKVELYDTALDAGQQNVESK